MLLSPAAILWFTRGTSFFSDEFTCFVASRGFDPQAILSPHNGHLFAGLRVLYATVFELFGANYLVLRVVQAVGVPLVVALFFVLAKRRIPTALALAPAVLLLFFGSAPDVTLSPLGIPHVYCLAAGLGAMIGLERRTCPATLPRASCSSPRSPRSRPGWPSWRERRSRYCRGTTGGGGAGSSWCRSSSTPPGGSRLRS